MNDNLQSALTIAVFIAAAIALIFGIYSIVSSFTDKGNKGESYHGQGGYSVWFHEQEPRCHPNCDGCARCPGYKDSVNRDYLYRAYMRNTSPYAYDNNRFCTTHAYNTCDGRRSGSRDVNTGKWHPIVVT